MGNCSSCLGARRRSVYEECRAERTETDKWLPLQDDESRLLFDDADGAHYGSFGEPAMNDQDEAQESQREFEALQSVVARTSDNMVDVFEIAPPRPNPNGIAAPYAALGIPDNRFAQYQNLLSKLSVTDEDDPDACIEEFDSETTQVPQAYVDALPTQVDVAGPFVSNFTDAAP
ncbi:hypothetical protein SPBR_07902 [Sporothrix brasiliensis 5110]|uniref:Uncharacterized protein n=1 Tax=Sporothrix brasiliensis 5110 TaxID=1398154 RepID=A0A0C2IHW7_9PEZI|nr:uncharacterized protein SPBR_07902 [Sporothrix brasiliensis 5110]KIH88756.1 hypothetical protein SPBR_07902 [Sporothrix brasiliensis 5110]